jgi:hypothetical protein
MGEKKLGVPGESIAPPTPRVGSEKALATPDMVVTLYGDDLSTLRTVFWYVSVT